MTVFDDDTAVTLLEPGRYRAALSKRWWIVAGPNGGYLAAIVVRALTDHVGDPGRRPRSLTVHFTAPADEGEVEVTVETLRVGGSLTTLAARMRQGDRLVATALAAFSRERSKPALEFLDMTPPVATPFDGTPPADRDPARVPPMTGQMDIRPVVGDPPFSGSDRAVTGGWMALADRRSLDPAVVTLLTDAWLPALFVKATDFVAAPTIDLTVHFRHPVPDGLDHCLAVFASGCGEHGFWEEDGELWSPDGLLLAQSRQLALALPVG